MQFDIVGPLVVSYGYRYILTITDRTSRWLEAYPLVDATAKSCLWAFLQEWVPRYGIPSEAVSDNGPSFIAQIWKGLHDALGTVVSYTPVYNPASLGGLERQHRDLKASLRAVLNQMGDEHGSNWLPILPWVHFACTYP